ncbi:hypothetical protein RVF83_10885 [Gordonia rubripertincta]|uniref:DUF4439 domain-containing protein n=1 Tax=Gordonia rubripertincta TaxID=36822 RepID=A0AAW4G383_GORRU|nr:hypothetical protein [Gordonia rubripertincta]MBM7277698.1 hypothetical protein [Gordonia rubripertincta]MDG6782693.1 hypothetical protein [Gordonia rubripertincta]NKY62046.1 hypothetical protein [Gordonia rubripertincta]
MTSTLSARASKRSTRKFLEPSAIAEAIAIEQHIVLSGYQALTHYSSTFGLTEHLVREIDDAAGRHQAIVSRLRRMHADALAAETISSAHQEALAALGLLEPSRAEAVGVTPPRPVQVCHVIQSHPARLGDPASRAIVSLAFLLVAVHALTDPTNCGTASPSLNLVPPPLHRDRALLEKVLVHAVAAFDEASIAELTGYISEASASFAGWSTETQRGLSVLRYNPHSLRTSCQSVGLREIDVRIAG